MANAVWDWANAVCEEAKAKAREGDGSILRGFDEAWSFYLANVFSMRSVSHQQLETLYPQYAAAIRKDYAAYLREEQTASLDTRMSSIEQALLDLQKAVAALTAQPATETPAPVKSKPGRKAKAAPPPEEESEEAEEQAEDESEA